MNPLNFSKEVARLGTTHGLSKDVIDLLQTKASLLESELQQSQSREKEKDSKIANLEAQLSNLQPVGFIEFNGLLWKKNASGFEDRPYCPECTSRPVMSEFPPLGVMGKPLNWKCPKGHTFAYQTEKPKV